MVPWALKRGSKIIRGFVALGENVRRTRRVGTGGVYRPRSAVRARARVSHRTPVSTASGSRASVVGRASSNLRDGEGSIREWEEEVMQG